VLTWKSEKREVRGERPRRWARSLYWRIGLGFILFLAVMLVAQASLFIWITVRTEGGMPERMGRDFAELVAADFEAALARDPALDLEAYARQRLAEFHRPAMLVFTDGRSVAPEGMMVPRGFLRSLPGGPADPAVPGRGPGRRDGADGRGPGGRSGAGGPRAGGLGRLLFGGPPRVAATAPVRAAGITVATVVVPPFGGAGRVASEFGPWLALGALLLLVSGTALAALLIFRPAQARLRALEDAARRLGEGDLATRAPEGGGDEVAAVARAFNTMAGELGARDRQLREADRARRQLLADVSHELMTPLTAIRGYAETLALPQFAPASSDGQRSVRVILEESDRIERLVGDLLDLARYEAGGLSLTRDRVVVADLFDRVLARHAQEAQAKSVTLTVAGVDRALALSADAGRIEQALQNLASNALRHTPSGGAVTLAADADATSVRLRVADTGTGIAAEHLPHVFDRFYKADAARSQAGSGLGLSIVKAIVERHGGRVGARSTPGVETVFEIELPRDAGVATRSPS